jgi:Ca-activated chloride channel family protein
MRWICKGALAALLAMVACDPGAPGGAFGARQGGVQDLGLARALVAAGNVPPADAFVVEGMFGEHDLGLAQVPCPRLLCLQEALGWAPTLEGTESGWLQVALSSSIDPDTFQRPPLALVAAVDTSGSMASVYGDDPPPIEIARELLGRLAATLGPADLLAIVRYEDGVHDVLPPTAGDRQAEIQAAIATLVPGGSTNMEAGLVRAYYIAGGLPSVGERRVLLFSDEQPNVGAVTPSSFERLVASREALGIGLTLFGVGPGLSPDVMRAMAHLRGANAFTLFDGQDVERLVTQDWPWLACPIAYDLSLAVEPGAGFAVAETYGFPDDSAALDVATVFLSRRRGALLLRFAPGEELGVGDLRASVRYAYRTPAGELLEDAVQANHAGQPLDARGMMFEDPAVARTVALALLVDGMRRAAEIYPEDPAAAETLLVAADARFAADAAAIGDPTLQPDVDFSAALLALVRARAPQGTLYPQ